MRKVQVFCDICGKEVVSEQWHEKSCPIRITTQVSAQNPMGMRGWGEGTQLNTFAKEDVCPKCQIAIATAIADALDKLIQNDKQT